MVPRVAPVGAAYVPALWVGLISGTGRTPNSTVGRPVGWSATIGLLAIPYAPSRRLCSDRLRFRSVLPIGLFPFRHYGRICARFRRSPCDIVCPVSYKNFVFARLVFSFRLSAYVVGQSSVKKCAHLY